MLFSNACMDFQDLYEKKMKFWGKRAPGIVAKMMSTLKGDLRKRAFGLDLKEEGAGASLKYWKLILIAKFEQNGHAKQILQASAPHVLVEKARLPRESNYWNASISKDGKTLIGKNVMGKLLQHVRDL